MTKKQSAPPTFETSLAELETIVRQMESGDLPLEESLQLFEQGVRLSHECQTRLTEAERRIEVLLRDAQGRFIVKSLDEAHPETLATKRPRAADADNDLDDDDIDEDDDTDYEDEEPF